MHLSNRVLLVDDEETILRGCSRHFEREGYEVTTASSGEKAIEFLHDNFFHLVVTDLVMKDTDGIAVLKEAKKHYPNIGTILLTGFGDMKSAVTALRLGADDYLLKPCDSEELLIRSQRCIEKHRTLMLHQVHADTLPICVYCKSIRDDSGKAPGKGEWLLLEEYFSVKNEVEFSHTCCPDCATLHYNDTEVF